VFGDKTEQCWYDASVRMGAGVHW